MRCLIPLPTLLTIITGCADDAHPANPDAGSLADANVAGDATEPPVSIAYALGTDLTAAGILSSVELPDLTLTQNLVAGVASDDSVVRAFDGKLYIINRFGSDNVTIIDPAVPTLVAQISTGAGTNPQDVAVVGNSIYVCAFNSGNIIILDESKPTALPRTIDISTYDPDGVPNCSSIAASGARIYATLGLLDDMFASQGGKVVSIDPSTDTIDTAFDLTYKNPFGLIAATDLAGPFGGDLLVGTTEDFATGNGCIERIAIGATPVSAGCLVNNAALGGFVWTMNADGDSVWVAVGTSHTEGKLIRVSSAGVVDDTSLTPSGQHVTDLAVCPTGHLITNDRANGTLVAYDGDGNSLSARPLDIGLPPPYSNGLVCL